MTEWEGNREERLKQTQCEPVTDDILVSRIKCWQLLQTTDMFTIVCFIRCVPGTHEDSHSWCREVSVYNNVVAKKKVQSENVLDYSKKQT